MEKKNLIVIVGLGNVGRELLRLLPKDIHVVVIDKDPSSEEFLKEQKLHGQFIAGDATSRLVLKEAPVEEAECVIITTTSEETNIEVATLLATHFRPTRVISVGITQEGIKKLQDLSVEVEPIFSATAVGIRNKLQPKTRAAHGIGLGRGEVLEVEVHPHSRLANRAIGSIAPLRWRIGLIYRGDNIILPRKDVMIKPGDRLLVLGEPGVLKTVAELFTFSFQRFPLEYGTTGVVYITGREDQGFIEEVKYALGIFPLQQAFLVFPPSIDKARYLSGWEELREFSVVLRESALGPLEAMEELFYEIQAAQALVVVSHELFGLYGGPLGILADIKARQFFQHLLDTARCPVLVARGTFPYEKTLVPALTGLNFSIALEKAIEVSSLVNNQVSAMLVEPSKYTATEEEALALQEARKRINELGLLHKRPIQVESFKGNPIRQLRSITKDYHLMVLGSAGWEHLSWRPTFIRPDLLWMALRGSPVSTLLIPAVEEAL